MNKNKNKVILYTDKRGNVELRADVEEDTLWASQAQAAQIFGTTLQNVNLHLINIYKERELNKKATIKESLIVQTEGGRSIQRPVILYNLDAIIAVGYRINSKKATKFRIWATRILREHLINGFTLDQKKLVTSEKNLNNLQEVITFMKTKSQGGPVKGKLSFRVSKDIEI